MMFSLPYAVHSCPTALDEYCSSRTDTNRPSFTLDMSATSPSVSLAMPGLKMPTIMNTGAFGSAYTLSRPMALAKFKSIRISEMTSLYLAAPSLSSESTSKTSSGSMVRSFILS
jgi:hypothetical protein